MMYSKAFYEPEGVYGTRYEVFRNSNTVGLRRINGFGDWDGPLVEAKINPERSDGKYVQGVLSALHRKSQALLERVSDSKEVASEDN